MAGSPCRRTVGRAVQAGMNWWAWAGVKCNQPEGRSDYMASRNPEQPNLLFVLSDDQGAWAMGCAGNEEIRSPNLDRLAREGIRFDNFYCASPVCSPARASILTGRIPSQHGVHDFVSMPHDREGKPDLDIPANSIAFWPACRVMRTCWPKSATTPAFPANGTWAIAYNHAAVSRRGIREQMPSTIDPETERGHAWQRTPAPNRGNHPS